MSNSPEYIKGQTASGIQVGDIVRVMRSAKHNEGGWTGGSWTSEMDKTIGKDFMVDDIGSKYDTVSVRLRLGSGETRFYPYFVLSIVKKVEL